MRLLARILGLAGDAWPTLLEVAGLGLVAAGLREIYPAAALILSGAAFVFIAQGLERDE